MTSTMKNMDIAGGLRKDMLINETFGADSK